MRHGSHTLRMTDQIPVVPGGMPKPQHVPGPPPGQQQSPMIGQTANRTVTFDGVHIQVVGKRGRVRWVLPFVNLGEVVFKPSKGPLGGSIEFRPYVHRGANAEIVLFRTAEQPALQAIVEALWQQIAQRPATEPVAWPAAVPMVGESRTLNRLLTLEMWATGLMLVPLGALALIMIAALVLCGWALLR